MDSVNRKITRSFSVSNWKPPDGQGFNGGGGSSWKFWRRLSFRSRGHDRSKVNKDITEAGLITKSDIGEPLDLTTETASLYGTRDLPDVLDRAHPLPVFNANAVPPPKPPRLFLLKSPSNEDNKSSFSESAAENKLKNIREADVTPTYMNCERVKHVRSQLMSSGDFTSEASEPGENNNVIGKLSLDNVLEEHVESVHHQMLTNCELRGSSHVANEEDVFSKDCDSQTNVNNNTNTPPTLPLHSASPSSSPSRIRSSNHTYHCATTPRRPKIVTPELSHKRYGRSRRKSSGGGHNSRQRHIMNSVLDLMCQRLDPYPLLDPLKRAGVLTNVHLQSFLGHRHRKSVCEDLADVIGKGSAEYLSVFCAVMASCPGNSTDILEILQVMREIDRIVHEIPPMKTDDDDVDNKAVEDCSEISPTLMAKEKTLNFDIGYLGTDYVLKPLVELGRVRSNTSEGSTKRLSTTSSRNSSYSLLETNAGPSSILGTCNNGTADNDTDLVTFPGLVMMCVSITGHSLAGERSEALADVIRGHNCISELHLGKTHLSGPDVLHITQALAESTIHSLDIRLNAIGTNGAEAITQLLRQSRFLRILNLSSTELCNPSFQQIVAAISSNKSMVEFDGSFLDITDECCFGLRDMLRVNTTLQKLRLRGNNLTCVGCQTLCEGLVRNIGLSALDLSKNPIGDAGIEALAQYLPVSHVTDICIDGCGISPNGGQVLSELISGCKKLKHLDASTNALGDSGIIRLAPALERTSSVVSVSLNMCMITNDGFYKLLDVLEKNTSIQGLKLCYNKLGDNNSNPAATSENLRYWHSRLITCLPFLPDPKLFNSLYSTARHGAGHGSRYRLRIVTSSKPKLKILLWGNAFDES